MNELAAILKRLRAVIAERKQADPETSYVARMYKKGRRKIAQKVGEEAVEVAIAAVAEGKDALVKESADLLFHLLMLWESAEIDPAEVAKELEKREGTSGLDEKKTRRL